MSSGCFGIVTKDIKMSIMDSLESGARKLFNFGFLVISKNLKAE